ncbi:MAG TPA: hypothetical protein VML96_02110 [Egibacteraceae bacterium]|nr:hypothetical protein [Egibacteraceae bacterium]
MTAVTPGDGLHIVDWDLLPVDDDAPPPGALDGDGSDEYRHDDGQADWSLETLRDAFVDAFNARDLDGVLGIVRVDVECPDITGGSGVEALTEELEAIWERSPAAILTRAFLDARPCAVAWLPDEDGCWSRAGLVTLAEEQGLLSVVTLPEDADALDRAEADEPTGEELDEWQDWAEWDRGEETLPGQRR